MKIYGNRETVNITAEMIRKNREPHSIVITGEKGHGKKALARYIAAQLLCEEQTGIPCGRCRACRLLERDAHPDYIIAKANERGNYPVEDIREKIVADAVVMPNEGRLKVYVIPDFDRSAITSVQIQNIMLKLIEEPPPHVAVILTARSKEIFLDTIISRVLTLNMVSVSDQESADYLQENYPDKTSQDIADAVNAGHGNIGRCKEYTEAGQFYSAVAIARGLSAEFANKSEYGILKTLFGADGKKALMREGVYLFSEIIRDASVLSLGGTEDMTFSCDRQGAKKIARMLSPAECAELYDLLREYIKRIDANCNLTLTANSLTAVLAGPRRTG